MLILIIKAEQPQRFHRLDHSVEKPYHLEKKFDINNIVPNYLAKFYDQTDTRELHLLL